MLSNHSLERLDFLAKKSIESDPRLHQLLLPFFLNDREVGSFVHQCLKKMKTRRMLLRVQWYDELANLIRQARDKRPALPLIFLMAMAESTARALLPASTERKIGSLKAVKNFFSHIEENDKVLLQRSIRRTLRLPNTPQLQFLSIIKILWQVRNNAVHGTNFWDFGLPDTKKTMDQYYSLITEGQLGSRKHQRRVMLEVKIPYEKLRDIFIRTAIQAIKIPARVR